MPQQEPSSARWQRIGPALTRAFAPRPGRARVIECGRGEGYLQDRAEALLGIARRAIDAGRAFIRYE